MKQLLKLFCVLLFSLGVVRAQAQSCCPKFDLSADFQPCDNSCSNSGPANPGLGAGARIMTACKNNSHTYYVVPNLPGFTYTWTVLGGTPASFVGNPNVITWGNGSTGYIQVIIKNADSSCRDTIRQQVCLVDGPIASFTFAPNPVCLSPSFVQFTSTSTGGSNYYWDFGDGTTSILQNPIHAYTSATTYVVTLTVSTAPSGGGGAGQQPERDCHCKDTAKATITVSNLTGIDIHTDDCRKMLCAGDTAKYCTSTTGCSGITWAVNGGTIINGQGTTCIKVVWDQPSVWPTTVKLTASCPGTCGNSAIISVPVLYPNLPIQGPLSVCVGSTSQYTLPVLPGTFYKWTLSGGGNIIGPDSNTAVINVNWTALSGSYTIICKYSNPYSGCSGADTITVTITPKFQLMGPNPACTNQPANYFANGPVLNWTFSPNIGFTNSPIGATGQTMTWSMTGTYTITATPQVPANFCTPSASIYVVVNPTPVLNPITGANVICPNTLTNYSVTSNTAGGQFTWTLILGTGNVSGYGPNNSSASVNFTGSGPWTLQASQTVNGCTGSITLSITKVGPPPPITITPPGSPCSGGSITASVTGGLPPGGYTWSATPGAVLTGGQGTTSANFTVNSNATITVTSCGGSSTINVTTSAATVTITKVNNTCSATLTASPGGGTYNWFLNGNPYTSGNPVTVTQNGTYVVLATYPGGCTATNQIIVTGITPVVAFITATGNICTGPVTIQSGIPANCPTPVFTWSNGFVGNPLIVNVPGTYFVTVTCANGCSAISNSIVIPPCVGNGNGNGNCINDLTISPSNCNNPVALTTNIPVGCSSNTTTWYYGDGGSNTTGTHYYNNVGNYTVQAIMNCGDGTVHCGTQVITVPMVDSFTNVISCGINGWSIQLQDASLYLPAYAGYTLSWTASCGSLNATNIPNPVLTVPIGCNPTVTLTISKNGCTLTKSFTFSFPNTLFTILGPNPVCQGTNNSYNSSYNTGIISYNWTFGDIPPTTGVTNPITHAFTGNPVNPTITLTIKDQYGCIFTTSINVNVIVPRALTITPSPLVKICPDCAPPVTLTSNPITGFTGYQWYHDGAAIGGANGPTHQLCNFDASGNYYVTALDAQNNNCPVTSDTVKVVYLPKPIADIQGATIWCSSSTPGNIYLNNSVTNPNYTYVWTVTGPGTVTFTPDNLQSYANVSVSAFGSYQFILTVTDITTGCIAKDTACVFLFANPTINVNAPPGPLCEGTLYTFNVIGPNPNWVYLWSNGVSGPILTTSQPGAYFVTVTNPNSGCNATTYAGMIFKRPDVSLFPLGCDTLCDTAHLIPPLPLAPGQTYGSQYIIKWYVDGNLYYTGPVLTLLGLPLGPHLIHIVVTSMVTGCSSTSGDYNLYIKHCGDCDCKGSKWGEITMTQGNNPPKTIKCNNNYTLNCNVPYTFNASFICKDSSCPGKTTYILYPPTGSPITGNMPLTFTPVPGVYILTIYGWCGDKKCDSCTIDLTVKCDCDCKESHWGNISLTPGGGHDGGGDGGDPKAVIIGNPNIIALQCKSTYNLNCNQPYTVNANFICKDSSCPSKVTYSLQPPSGSPITGVMPLTFTPTLSGTYTLTLYGWCGDKICDSCVIYFKVICDKCNCKGSHWGELTVTDGIKTSKLNCGKEYNWKCKVPFTINGLYICSDPACPGTATYTLNPPVGGPLTGTLPLTYTPTVSGNYSVILVGMCGGKPCDTCRFSFHVDCPQDTNCCKHDITIQAGTVTYSAGTNSTIAAQTFTITGLAGVPLTEVRAEVLSYDISSGYNNECLNCKTLPFTWASISSAGNIGVVGPKITLYGGVTTPTFNPTGAAVYQNPREVIWNGAINITGPINMSFILPPSPTIDCCELKGKICVKFTFRDENCNECEVIACFDFL